MNEDITPRRIRCSKVVKKYNTDNLKRIADMGCGEVYQSLKSSGGIVTRRCMNCKELAEQLIEKIPGFLPSEPKVGADLKKMQQIHEAWTAHLRETIERICKPVKPVYLTEEVTKKLQEKGSDIKCENVHLEWYLATRRGKAVTPEKVAAAILAYDGTDWSSVKRLVKDDAYNIRVEDEPQSTVGEDQKKRSYIRNRYEAVTKVFEFIWSLPAVPHIDTLEERLKNDLQIFDELAAWRKQDTEDYDYSTKYQEFLSRLQTLPAAVKKIKFKAAVPPAKEKAESKAKAKALRKVEAAPEQVPEEPDYISDLEMVDPIPEETKENPSVENHSEDTTAPDDPFEVAKQKFNAGEKLSPADIAVLIAHKICPACGSRKGLWDNRAKYKSDGTILYDANRNCMECDTRFILSPEGVFKYPVTPKTDRQLIE